MNPVLFRNATLVLLALAALGVTGCSSQGQCEPGKSYRCYPGPAGTEGVGDCKAGLNLCSASGTPGQCANAATPEPELCDGRDNDCDGTADENVTNACGGCTPLLDEPGQPCESCGQTVCEGKEAVSCGVGVANNCGACGAAEVPGLNVACTGPDGCAGATGCADGGLSAVCKAPRKNNCGVCGAADVPGVGGGCTGNGGCPGILACNGAGTGGVCGAPAPNNCGACGAADVTGVGDRCTLSGPGCGVRACNAAGNGTVCLAATEDPDGDGVKGPCDNCPATGNANQEDLDGDGLGDVCDLDRDGDGVDDLTDVCPRVPNAGQADGDGDGHGDVCDNCLLVANPDQADLDTDGKGDVCQIRISELAAAGAGGASDEFVELYNAAAVAVDLSGWKFQYRSETGGTYSAIGTLPAGSSIPARGYFLFTSGGGSYSGTAADLQRTNASGAGIALGLAATSGHVRIGLPGVSTGPADPLGVDVLGYGAAGGAEGNQPCAAPNFGAGASLERKAKAGSTASSMESGADATAGNGYDSDNNLNDFVTRTLRQPQNRSSASEP